MSRPGARRPACGGGARRVLVGRISGVYGVRGWLKLRSDTEPPSRILDYAPWQVGGRPVEVASARMHGDTMLVKLVGIDDRDEAGRLVGRDVSVPRARLPALDDDEYYWADLIGLEVCTADGRVLGRVERLMDTGANDVLVVSGDRERLIPFVLGDVILDVDTVNERISVEWDPEF